MLSLWGTMKVKETIVLGEDFYSLAFYGYYKHPEDQIMEVINSSDDTKVIRNLDTIVADQIISNLN